MIISIHSPIDPPLFESGSDRVLVLAFDDITPGPFLMDRSLYEANVYFSGHHARQVIEFVERWEKAKETVSLMVNCAAGISRSGAVVTWALTHTSMKDHYFVEQNPRIQPNTWVLWRLTEAEFYGTG